MDMEYVEVVILSNLCVRTQLHILQQHSNQSCVVGDTKQSCLYCVVGDTKQSRLYCVVGDTLTNHAYTV